MTMRPTSSPHRIYVQPSKNSGNGKTKFGNSGGLYDARYEGELIVSSSHQPFLDACRVLGGRGITGAVEMWDHVRPFPRLHSTVEAAAQLTVSDADGPPRFRRYKNGLSALGRRGVDGA